MVAIIHTYLSTGFLASNIVTPFWELRCKK